MIHPAGAAASARTINNRLITDIRQERVAESLAVTGGTLHEVLPGTHGPLYSKISSARPIFRLANTPLPCTGEGWTSNFATEDLSDRIYQPISRVKLLTSLRIRHRGKEHRTVVIRVVVTAFVGQVRQHCRTFLRRKRDVGRSSLYGSFPGTTCSASGRRTRLGPRPSPLVVGFIPLG